MAKLNTYPKRLVILFSFAAILLMSAGLYLRSRSGIQKLNVQNGVVSISLGLLPDDAPDFRAGRILASHLKQYPTAQVIGVYWTTTKRLKVHPTCSNPGDGKSKLVYDRSKRTLLYRDGIHGVLAHTCDKVTDAYLEGATSGLLSNSYEDFWKRMNESGALCGQWGASC